MDSTYFHSMTLTQAINLTPSEAKKLDSRPCMVKPFASGGPGVKSASRALAPGRK
jgi:hypothetical protein